MQQQPFEDTPEAQEFLAKLQSGRIQLPPEANALEVEAFVALQGIASSLRNTTATRNDVEKQIEAAQGRMRGLERESDNLAGQLAAFAQILVSAEGARRTKAQLEEIEAAKPKPVEEGNPKVESGPSVPKPVELNEAAADGEVSA